MRSIAPVLALFLAMGAAWNAAQAKDQATWEMVDQSDGITSWKLKRTGQLPMVKGEVQVEASIDVVRKVLADWRHHTKWMHRCAEAVELERLNASETIMYNRTSLPWPVRDRDVIFKLRQEQVGSDVLFSFENLRSELKPEVDGVVRVPKMVGFYRLSSLAPNQTRIAYQLDTDVGGAIPEWVVKSILEKMPYETLAGLRTQISEQK